MNGYRVVFPSKGKAKLQEFEVSSIKEDEVLIENDYTAISAGTERANLIGLPNTSGQFPHRPGYSGAGRIAAVGSRVENLNVGDRVIVNWGGHCTHSIKNAQDVLKIDDDRIDMIDASFAHIASFPLLGVRKLRIELGESVMIAGMGILGAFAVQIARLAGAIPVIVSDLDPQRRSLALELGAAAAFSPDEDDFVENVKQATDGKGPNAVVEVTGSALALRQALEYIAREGRISLLGCTRISDQPIDFYKYVHRPGISLIGSHSFTRPKYESAPGRWTERDDNRTFLKLVASGDLKVRRLISKVVSPEETTEVYAELAENNNPPLGIVLDWNALRQ